MKRTKVTPKATKAISKVRGANKSKHPVATKNVHKSVKREISSAKMSKYQK